MRVQSDKISSKTIRYLKGYKRYLSLDNSYHRTDVPTSSIGAAFILAIALGLIVISGVLLKPYEARKVVESLHQQTLDIIEYRNLARFP